MLQKIKTLAIVFISTISLVFAQEKGKIAGKVEDAGTSEELIGVAVGIKGSSFGATTDIEGHYLLSLEPGIYTLVVSYVGYNTKEITEIEVKAGQTTDLKITLDEASLETEEVVVTATFKKESVDALLLERKNAVSVSDGVSADLIKKTPDRNTADILKRVSGATIQDNKFAIIRGLNERYNTAYINNAPLPSSEPDRKAFAFDIFPANMVESMNIYKTATPDLPGDFAGGVIKIKTRDIPDENFTSLTLGIRTNNITTFKKGYGYDGGKYDLLGVDDGTRKVPSSFPSREALSGDVNAVGLTDKQKDEIQFNSFTEAARGAKSLSNNWDVYRMPSLAPGTNLQFITGRKIGNKLGIILSLSYTRNLKNVEGRYREYNLSNAKELDYKDESTNDEVATSALGNISYKLNESNKISLKNTFNINSTDQALFRQGQDLANNFNLYKIYSTNYTQNKFNSHQLSGDHFIKTGRFKIDWTAGISQINRIVPDYKILSYFKSPEDGPEVKYRANVQGDPRTAGRFSSKMMEDIKSFSIDVAKPLPTFWLIKSEVKVGVFVQERSRVFNARQLVYKRFPNGGYDAKFPTKSADDSAASLTPDKIFDNSNLDFQYNPTPVIPDGFVTVQDPNDIFGLKTIWFNSATGEYRQIPEAKPKFVGAYTIEELTEKQNQYRAGSSLSALYFMFDNRIGGKIRLNWGLRYERFNQRLNTEIPKEGRIVALNSVKADVLPSVNLTISPISKMNLRLAYSKTLNRPEYRELAPFTFYDLVSNRTVIGYDSLKRATVNNYDARLEFFPGAGQVISVTYFYKDFKDPIERYQRPDAGGIFVEYDNAKSAYVRGWEFEVRQNLQILSPANIYLKRLTVSGNASIINSKVTANDKKSKFTNSRPLQGQSNHIVNAGVTYDNEENGFGLSFMINRVGRRIAFVGNTDEPNIWEKPRTVIDFQVSKAFLKKKLEAKINISDMLGQRQIFYQNSFADTDERFDTGKDLVVFDYLYGTNITYSLTYKF